jgi:hypothetical protein
MKRRMAWKQVAMPLGFELESGDMFRSIFHKTENMVKDKSRGRRCHPAKPLMAVKHLVIHSTCGPLQAFLQSQEV